MNERQEILELLAKGKINAEEAAEILSSVEKSPEAAAAPVKPVEPIAPKAPEAPAVESGKKPSWFKVRVRNLETGKNKVTVNIPLGMVDFGLKLGRHFAPELEGLDYEELTGMMKNMGSGMLVEVEDEEDNEHVQIFVE
ncbi:MAG: hypothetical protein H6667_02290 [Ardenticatenaceae bacterium]|nr:hypothetical protein [Ardenticatenaceae bacterium]MCB9443339.1 hypothetical protein [Ardenticatenaceae bacterium]